MKEISPQGHHFLRILHALFMAVLEALRSPHEHHGVVDALEEQSKFLNLVRLELVREAVFLQLRPILAHQHRDHLKLSEEHLEDVIVFHQQARHPLVLQRTLRIWVDGLEFFRPDSNLDQNLGTLREQSDASDSFKALEERLKNEVLQQVAELVGLLLEGVFLHVNQRNVEDNEVNEHLELLLEVCRVVGLHFERRLLQVDLSQVVEHFRRQSLQAVFEEGIGLDVTVQLANHEFAQLQHDL